jgi:hypothetical protein
LTALARFPEKSLGGTKKYDCLTDWQGETGRISPFSFSSTENRRKSRSMTVHFGLFWRETSNHDDSNDEKRLCYKRPLNGSGLPGGTKM